MNRIEIHRTCPICHKMNTVVVDRWEYLKWVKGMFIQDAMPTTSVEDREILMTGIDKACWDKTFPDE